MTPNRVSKTSLLAGAAGFAFTAAMPLLVALLVDIPRCGWPCSPVSRGDPSPHSQLSLGQVITNRDAERVVRKPHEDATEGGGQS